MHRIFNPFALALACLIPCTLQAATVTRGPYLQNGSHTSIVVRWRTNTATDSQVLFGTVQGTLNFTVSDAALVTEHIVTLSGLNANTTYFYSVGSSTETLAGNDADHFFITAPAPGSSKPTRIWVLGDPGTADANARSVRDAYYSFTGARHTDLWLMLGDNAYDSGTDAEFQAAVFDTYPTMLRKSVLWSCLGNHETNGSTNPSPPTPYPYFQLHTFPTNGSAGGLPSGTEAYFSFDYGDIHIVSLDSQLSSRAANGAMAQWLANDLAATNKTWIIALFHHPPYSKGSHNSDTDPQSMEMRANLNPILEAGGVDLVLNGHSHAYERTYLIDGHYGTSATFLNSMKKDGGDGRPSGNGAYDKNSGANLGAVYTLTGSAGKLSTAGSHNHPAVFSNIVKLGSFVIDIDGNRLDAKFIEPSGAITDSFSMLKGTLDIQPPTAPSNLIVTANTDTDVALSWSPSTDNTGVAAYKIFRNNVEVGSSLTTQFTDTGLTGQTSYSYHVQAQDISGNRSANSNTVSITTSSTPGVVYWVGPVTGGSWNNPANWDSNPLLPDALDVVSFPGTMTNASVTLDANQSIKGLTLSAALSNSLTISSGGNFSLSVGSSGLINSASTGVLNADLVLTNNASIVSAAGFNLTTGNVNSGGFALSANIGGTATISGVISGAGTLSKSGVGRLTLAGVNTFSGSPVTSTAGTISLASNSAFGSAGNTLTLGATTLQFTAPLTLARAITLAGALTVELDLPNPGSITGLINGNGALTKSGDGVLTLTSANTFVGTVTVSEGILRSGINTAFSGATTANSLVVNSGATLDTNGFNNNFKDLSLSAGTVQTGAGKIVLQISTITATSQNNNPSVISGFVDLGGTDRNFVINAGDSIPDLIVSAVLQSGAGTTTQRVIKSGTGIMRLTAANTYIQQTRVDNGTLLLDGNSATLANSASLTLNGGEFLIDDKSGADVNRIGDSTPLTFNGGKLSISAPLNTSRTETVGLMTFASGASTISLTASGSGNSQLTMNSAAQSPGRTGSATFNFERNNAAGGNGTANLFYSSGGPATIVSFSSVNNGTDVYDGTGSTGSGLIMGTPETTPPSAPTNLVVSGATDVSVSLTWTAATDNVAVVLYRIFRDNVFVGTSSSTVFTDTGLASSTTYSYKVAAEDPSGNVSPDSNSINAMTAVSSIIVPMFSTWKYLDTGVDQGTAWRAVVFDDTLWNSGPATLGYGGTPTEATVVSFGPSATAKYPTTYFRRSFNVADRSLWNVLRLSVLHDDGAVVYLNGQELSRFNMPAGQIAYGTFASTNFSGTPTVYSVPASVSPNTLVNGNNLLAVEIHQSNASSGDILFDMQLQGFFDSQAPTAPSALTLVSKTPNTASFNWTASTDDFGLAGYKVFRDGVFLADSATAVFNDSGLSAATAYSYSVRAIDVAGNLSAESAPLIITTDPANGSATWIGPVAGGSWNNPNNWSGSQVPASSFDVTFPATMDDAVVTLDANQSLKSLSLNAMPGKSISIVPNGAFTLTVGSGGILNQTASANINADITLISASTFTTPGGTTLTFGKLVNAGFALTVDAAGNSISSGIISGSGALIKSGSGTFSLNGINTFTGVTNLNAGTLKLGHASALGAASANTVVAAGAVLDFNGIISTEPLNLSGTLTNTSATAATASGAIVLAANSTFSATGTLTLGGIISGGFSVVKEGPGIVFYNTTNTYSGLTTVNAGILRLKGDTGTLGSGSLLINPGANFDVDSQGTANANVIATAGNITLNGGTYSQSAPATGSAARTEGFGGLIVGAGSSTLIVSPTATASATLTAANSMTRTGGGTFNFVRDNSGLGNLILTGFTANAFVPYATVNGRAAIYSSTDGLIEITALSTTKISTAAGSWSNPATWVGGVIPAAGNDVIIRHAVVLANAAGNADISASIRSLTFDASGGQLTAFTPGAPGTLTLTGGGIAVAGAAAPLISVNLNANNNELIVNHTGSASATISGAISSTSAAGLSKGGSGALLLGGANTYTGATNVQGGTLIVNSSLASNAGITTVAQNATLAGSGTVRGLVNNGTVAPGLSSGIGTLFSANTTFGAGSVLHVEVPSASSANDLLDMSSGIISLNAGAVLRVDLNNLNAGTAQEFVVAKYASAGATPFTLTVVNNAFNQAVALSYRTSVTPHEVLVAVGTNVTPVTLDAFTATAEGAGVTLQWTAVSEFNNAGFYVQKRHLKAGKMTSWMRINPSLIPGRLNHADSKNYLYCDWPPAGCYEYKLECVDIYGHKTHHFPSTAGIEIDWNSRLSTTAIHPVGAHSIDAAALHFALNSGVRYAELLIARSESIARSKTNLRTTLPAAAVRGLASIKLPPPTLEQRSSPESYAGLRWFSSAITAGPAAQTAAKLSYTHAGVLLLPQTALPPGFNLNALKIQREGRSLTALAQTPSGLLLYGPGYQDNYTNKDAIFLRRSSGTTVARKLLPAKGLFDTAQSVNVTIPATSVTHFHDVYFDFNLRPYNYEPWFSAKYLSTGSTQSFAVNTPQASGGAAVIKLTLCSLPDSAASNAPRVLMVSINGQLIGQTDWRTQNQLLELSLTVPAGVLTSGANSIELVTPPDSSHHTAVSLLHSISINYTRLLDASQPLEVINAGSSTRLYELHNLPNATVWIVDNRYSGREALLPVETQLQANGTYRARFSATPGGTGRFSVIPSGMENRPLSVELRQIKPVRLNGTYVAAGPAQFAQGVQPLLVQRSREGIRGVFVDQEKLFDYYNHGRYGPDGIRNVVRSLRPTYLLLVGRTTYDYLNHSGNNVDPLCPAFLVATSFWSQTTSDSAFGDLGRGYPEVAIGRLPVNSTTELVGAVTHILGYTGLPRSGIRLHAVADRADPTVADFGMQLDTVMKSAHPSLTWQENYLGRTYLSVTESTAALKQAANGGSDLILYSGHGSALRLGATAPPILDTNSVQDWTGNTILLQATCTAHWMAKNESGYNSVVIRALTQPQGGIAAGIGSSTYTNPGTAVSFMNELLSHATSADGRWGGALLKTQQWSGAHTGNLYHQDLMTTQQLFGDPAMRVFRP